MLKGLYTAYTGMLNEQNRMDVLTNNLANSSTVGFKKEGTTSQGFDRVLTYRIKEYGSTVVMITHNMNLLEMYPGRVYECKDHQFREVSKADFRQLEKDLEDEDSNEDIIVEEFCDMEKASAEKEEEQTEDDRMIILEDITD